MNNSYLRFFVLVLHALANVAVIAFFTNFDLTGNWFAFGGFIIALLVLLLLFVQHLLLFLRFIKNKTK